MWPHGRSDESFPIQCFLKTQFPVRRCFEIAANSAREQCFSGALGLVFYEHIFSNGQLYVILPRATHPETFYSHCPMFPLTQKMVYGEVFQIIILNKLLKKKTFFVVPKIIYFGFR